MPFSKESWINLKLFYIGRFFLSIVVTNGSCHTPTHPPCITHSVNYTFSIHLFFKTFQYFKNILNCANSMDEKWNEHWRYSCLKRYAFQSTCFETSVRKIFKLITDFWLDLNVPFGRFHALNTKIVNFLWKCYESYMRDLSTSTSPATAACGTVNVSIGHSHNANTSGIYFE